MGSVWKNNQDLAVAWPAVDQGKLEDILIDPSQQSPTYTLASLTQDEAITILKKLDSLAPGWSPQITAMLTEGAYAVIKLVQLVKAQTKQQFRGFFAQGAALDLRLLRAKDIGGPILNGGLTATSGIYGGVTPPGAGYPCTYLNTFVAKTTQNLIPSQTMLLYGGCVHFGFIDPIEVPPIDAVQWTLYGVAVPLQSTEFKAIKTIDSNELPVAKLEKPIIVPPLGIQQLTVFPYRSGDSKIQPITVVCGRAQDFSTL